MYYHIILTEKCNSRCKYCYEKSMEEFENGLEKKWQFEKSPFDSEVKISDLKKFLKSSDTLIFYGGEPLLQIEKIKKIMDSVKCKFCIQTNGKLLDKLPKKYFLKLNKILISIDGSKKITDFNKGNGTYDLVLKNIQNIRKKGFKGEIVARMVISTNFPRIDLSMKSLLKLNLFDSIHWQIDAGFYKNDFDKRKFKKFVKIYNKSIFNLVRFWGEEMKKGKVYRFYPFLGILNSILSKEKTLLRCGAGHSNYTITTSGKLSACPIMNSVKNFYCGDIKKGIEKKISIIEPCIKCKYLHVCGGRCLYSNYAKLWPRVGQKLICRTIIFLIKQIQDISKQVQKLIDNKIISRRDLEYEKYFGPEIIP